VFSVPASGRQSFKNPALLDSFDMSQGLDDRILSGYRIVMKMPIVANLMRLTI